MPDSGKQPGKEGDPRNWFEREGREWLKSGIYALILFFVIRTFFVQAYKIPSASMEKTLLVGDFLLVNKLVYGPIVPFTDVHLPALREPKRGDILVFKYPLDKSLDFVKRCVAVGGDTVEMRDKVLYVNGARMDEGYAQYIDPRVQTVLHRNRDRGIQPNRFPLPRDNFGPIVVPPGKFFVLGDNRDNSRDSRYWGFVDRGLIEGTPLFVYFSWDHDAFVPRFSRIGHLIK
jgi:signal peptidase I